MDFNLIEGERKQKKRARESRPEPERSTGKIFEVLTSTNSDNQRGCWVTATGGFTFEWSVGGFQFDPTQPLLGAFKKQPNVDLK